MDWIGHVEIRTDNNWYNYMPVFFARTKIGKQIDRLKKSGIPKDISAVARLILEYNSESENEGYIKEKDLYEFSQDKEFENDWNNQAIFDLIYMKDEMGIDEIRMIVFENP